MYIPRHFQNTKVEEAINFVKQFPFGLLSSMHEGRITGTHLPFTLGISKGNIVLYSHMARANPQWQSLEEQELLCVFNGPHAYISPENYQNKNSVPTWNYTAAHFYGKGEVLLEEQDVLKTLEDTIAFFDTSYQQQWEGLDADYRSKLTKAIVAFRIEVSETQLKEKLSQNKSQEDRSRIVIALKKSTDCSAKELAKRMQQDLLNEKEPH
jgi:transcriptional regulator